MILFEKTCGIAFPATSSAVLTNRQTALTDPLQRQTQFGFDADGNEVTVTDAAGKTTHKGAKRGHS